MRRALEANSESLNEAGDAAHVHIERVARAKRREPLRIRRAVDELRSQLAEIILEAGRRYDFQYSGRRVARVPKRVPLFARLEDQIARIVGMPVIDGDLPSLLGNRWEITAEIYDEFLEMMPPRFWRGGSFFCQESLFDDVAAKFTKEGDTRIETIGLARTYK